MTHRLSKCPAVRIRWETWYRPLVASEDEDGNTLEEDLSVDQGYLKWLFRASLSMSAVKSVAGVMSWCFYPVSARFVKCGGSVAQSPAQTHQQFTAVLVFIAQRAAKDFPKQPCA